MLMSAYWEPKAATAQSEWEDGAAYSAATGWFAVTDGASTGSNSREWAYTLASRFVGDRPAEIFDDGTGHFAAWLENVRAHFDPRSPEFAVSRMPAWVQEAGERLGAYSTLLGARVTGSEVQAIAVGDCCLFHLGRDGRAVSFPLSDPGQFGTAPRLISSHHDDYFSQAGRVSHFRAPLAPGDTLFGASDALAEWLTGNLDDPDVWRTMRRIGHRGFRDLCGALRHAGWTKNDDVTLVRAIVPSADAAGP